MSDLHEQLIEIREIMARNTAILEINTEQLKEHIRRTSLLEERFEEERAEVRKQLETAMLPIYAAKFLSKAAAVVAGLGSASYALMKLVGLIR